MKKASRLLAMVMAVIMIMSAACLPIYAKNVSSDYTKPIVNTSRSIISLPSRDAPTSLICLTRYLPRQTST